MSATNSFDVLIIGNGAVGSAIAYELARRGAKVARVGPSDRPRAASMAAGAMLGAFGEVTRMTINEPNGQAKLAADLEARSLWPIWDSRLQEDADGGDSFITSVGTTVILNTIGGAAVDDGNFAAIEEALVHHGEPHETVDCADIAGLNPDDLSRPLRAIYIPQEKALHLPTLLQRLELGFVSKGGTLVDARVSTISNRSAGIEVILEDGDTLNAGHIIIACGSASRGLLSTFPDVQRRIPPLFNGYGVSVRLKPEGEQQLGSVVRTPNRAFACGLHAIPRGSHELYIGGTNVVRHAPRTHPTVRDLEFLVNCAVFQLDTNLAMSEIVSVQVGNRPVSADGFPLIGPSGVEGVWLATGTYRDGVGQSPLIADAIASSLDSGISMPDMFSAFAPIRPPIQIGSREEIVKLATEELVAAGQETHWTIRPEWADVIENYGRREFQDRADHIHGRYTPPPDVLAKMDSAMRGDLVSYYDMW